MVSPNRRTDADYSFPRRVLHVFCRNDHVLYMVLVLQLMLLLLAVLSAVFGDLDESGRAILLIDFLILIATTIPVVGVIVLCRRQ